MLKKDQEPPLGEQEFAPSPIVFKCRRDRLRTLWKLEVEKEVVKQGCPMEGRVESVDINDMGELEKTAAATYNEKCTVCGLEPTEYDFARTTRG